ncbi:NAD(P)/FAD-dependent oxidoreductase [Lentzea sp. NBRC 105346]|uniref:NAD(P)/FAD-dependent oxidoreductase n=1 Tax=Lentzea sp. NBRC 105346 TaxID=3032205 RepID=UPI002557085F|nr:NAD(P)/FAD-dependent oxidoreductase [Lentzea sp. NBRC 105346]
MDVVVIGGGAAGLNGALMLGRVRRNVLVIDAGEPRNAPAAHMHGFLTRDGMPPGELLEIGRKEVRQYGVRIADARVTEIVRDDDGFIVSYDGTEVRTKRVLVATGLVDELPDIPGLRERWGRSVIHCPYCHGWEVRDQAIGVIGDEHLELMFRQLSDDVIRFEQDQVTAITGTADVHLDTGETIPRQAVAIRGRHVARSEILTQLGLTPTPHPLGEFIEADPMGRTAVPGVYVAGNVTDLSATVLMAAASGAKAGAAINFDLLQSDQR